MPDLGTSEALRVLTQTTPDNPKIASLIYTNLYQIHPIDVKEKLGFSHLQAASVRQSPFFTRFRAFVANKNLC